jgi:hypothetical protein
VLTAFGATAVTFMMLMYAFERRHRVFVLAFALGCALSSAYGFLAGTWPFGAVEAIWALIAVHRYWQLRTDVAAAHGGSTQSAWAGGCRSTSKASHGLCSSSPRGAPSRRGLAIGQLAAAGIDAAWSRRIRSTT